MEFYSATNDPKFEYYRNKIHETLTTPRMNTFLDEENDNESKKTKREELEHEKDNNSENKSFKEEEIRDNSIASNNVDTLKSQANNLNDILVKKQDIGNLNLNNDKHDLREETNIASDSIKIVNEPYLNKVDYQNDIKPYNILNNETFSDEANKKNEKMELKQIQDKISMNDNADLNNKIIIPNNNENSVEEPMKVEIKHKQGLEAVTEKPIEKKELIEKTLDLVHQLMKEEDYHEENTNPKYENINIVKEDKNLEKEKSEDINKEKVDVKLEIEEDEHNINFSDNEEEEIDDE